MSLQATGVQQAGMESRISILLRHPFNCFTQFCAGLLYSEKNKKALACRMRPAGTGEAFRARKLLRCGLARCRGDSLHIAHIRPLAVRVLLGLIEDNNDG